MDWNLGNRNAKHFLLRDQIMYSDQVWVRVGLPPCRIDLAR